MSQRSLSAGTAVSLLFLLAASVLVWAEFGAFAVSVLRDLSGTSLSLL
jgi:hypothetical protein